MATYTDSYGFNKGSAALRAEGLNKAVRMEVVLDFAAIKAARAAAGATALASGDVLEVMAVPAKTLVMAVGYDVTKAEGGTATFDLGDGSDTDGYLNDINLNSVASGAMSLALATGTPNTVAGYSAGKYYAAADTIDVLLNNNDVNAAVVRIWALVADAS